MTWVASPPTEPGFYWVKRPRQRCVEVVEVYETSTGVDRLLVALQLYPHAYAPGDVAGHGITEWWFPALERPPL